MISYVRVFIGSEPKTEIARKVLEYSILQNTKYPVKFEVMLGDNWKVRPEIGVGTGFSLLRWDIARRCNYEDYAIYLDADILCLGDIKFLWKCDVNYPNKNCAFWCTYQPCKWFDYPTPETSVMLIDCAKARNIQPTMEDILKDLENDKDRKKYVQHMRCLSHTIPPQKIPNDFNRLNTLVENSTYFLHYTKEPEQPWYNPAHQFSQIWEKYFVAAIKDDYISKEEVKQQLKIYKQHTKKERGEGLHPYWKKVL